MHNYKLGYPDSAHNLGIIYQGFVKETSSFRDIKKAIEYFERAKQWGYSASCNARKLVQSWDHIKQHAYLTYLLLVGRMYLLMSKNNELAKEAGNPGSEPDDYIVTGIELMEVRRVT